MLSPNTLLAGRYLIQRLIGQGGMSGVYVATDTRISGKEWVVKEMSDVALHPTERQAAVHAFQREARLLATLDHPNLPRVIDSFTEGGRHYLVMDFVAGETLEEILTRSGPLPEERVLAWSEQLCDVLDYLHHRSPPIIFRDLKPGNVMIASNEQVKLIDFGIARHFTPGKKWDTVPMGTPGYAPPEQYGKGQTDARSDIYALGVTLHCLLTGHDPSLTPFNLPPLRSLNPDITLKTEAVIQKALQTAPENRFSSVKEMCQALRTKSPHSKEMASVEGVRKENILESLPHTMPLFGTLRTRLSQFLQSISQLLPGARALPTTGPILALPHNILNFGSLYPGKSSKQKFVIENKGQQLLKGILQASHPWVKVRSKVKIRGGRKIKVPFRVRTKGLTPGHHTARVEITSSGGNAVVVVKAYVVGADAAISTNRVEIPLKDNPTEKLEVLVGRRAVVDKLGTWIATTSEQGPRTFLITGYGSFGGTTTVRQAVEKACQDLAGRRRRADKTEILLVATLDLTKVPTRDLTKERLLRLLALELYAEIRGSEYDSQLQKKINDIRELQEALPRKEKIVTETKTESGQVQYGIRIPPTISVAKVLELGSLLDLNRQPCTETHSTSSTLEYERAWDTDLVLTELRSLLESPAAKKSQKRRKLFKKGFKLPRRTVIIIDKVADIEKLGVLRQVTDFRNVPCILIVDRKHFDKWATQYGGEQDFKHAYRIDDVIKLENLPGTVEDVCAAVAGSGRVSSEDRESLETYLRNIIVQTKGTAGGGVRQLINQCQPRHRRRWGKRKTTWTLSFPRPDETAKRVAHFQSHIERCNKEFFPENLSMEEQERVRQGLYCLLPWIAAYEKSDSLRFKSTEIRREAKRCFPLLIVTGLQSHAAIATRELRERIVFDFLKWLGKQGYMEKRGYWYYVDSSWKPAHNS